MTTGPLGERLRILIREKGLQQQEIAEQMRIKVPTFNGYVVGKREPGIEKLKQLADYFGVSIDYLVGYSDLKDPYLAHLPEELKAFVRDPENMRYMELAQDIKEKTLAGGSKSTASVSAVK